MTEDKNVLGDYAHVVVESSCDVKVPPEYAGPTGLNTDKFLEAAVSGDRLILLWKDGVTVHDTGTGELVGRWSEMGIGLDYSDCSPFGVMLLTQADRRDAPNGSAQQMTLLDPKTLAPIFSKPATSFLHERLPGDAPLSFERAYLANDGIIWAVSHEFASGADRTVLYEITREGKCLQVYVLSEPTPVLRKVKAVDHVGERERKISLVQLTCSTDRRWVFLIGKFEIWQVDIRGGQGAIDNPEPLMSVKQLTTFVRDMKMERIFWDVQNRFLLVTPEKGKEFVFFHYNADPKVSEYALHIERIGVYCQRFQSQKAGLFTWEKNQARPMLFKEQKLDHTQMFSIRDGRYLVLGDFGPEIPLLVFDTWNWKTVDVTRTDHPELVPVGLTTSDQVFGLEGGKLIQVRVEPGLPPKGTSWSSILALLLIGAAAVAGLLYYLLVVRPG